MMNANPRKIRITFYSAVLALAISSSSSMSLAGGGGGGAVINATVQLFATFIITQYVMTALTGTNLNYDPVPSTVKQVQPNYVKHLLNNPSSIWAATTFTPNVRLLLAQYYYYLVFRYAALAQATNVLLPGTHSHPNAITNQVAFVALQGFTQAASQLKKEIDDYKRRKKAYLLLSLIMMQNPYSPYFLFEIGKPLKIDFTYAPEVYLAETVTYILLQNQLKNYIDRLLEAGAYSLAANNNESRVVALKNKEGALMALMLLQYVILNRIIWQNNILLHAK